MTNSCRLFGLRHDNGGGPRDGEDVGVGDEGCRREKVMASVALGFLFWKEKRLVCGAQLRGLYVT